MAQVSISSSTSLADRHENAQRETSAQLFRTHHERMRKTAIACVRRFRLNPEMEADELVSAVFEAFLRGSPERLASVKGHQVPIYLDQCIRRKAIDAYRAKHRAMRDARRRASEPIGILTVCENSPVESAEFEMQELLANLCDSLTADERAIATLRRAGYEWKDIAAVLGRTEGAARMQFQRSFTCLKNQLC